ncbi:cation diffusion facilitator family transporter [Azomonas agilis]|uniref:Cation-efflux pump FieF n=1 Tax=Azomonas agilis TaxID=116849 RepID=A0A562J2W3_9GAMM|nr:cation diffusion facilitator family transporter [Azomonas agilis]TWH77463.1 cation diffusion facilitator family transporter [Azomonas agilis]
MNNPYHAQLMRRATYAALTVALSLALGKAIAWWLSESVSLLAGLTDSLLDGVASLLNLLAVHYALQPPDNEHRYGHGKAEALAGLGQATFIGLSAVLVGSQAIERWINPQPLAAPTLGILVMLLSLVLTTALIRYQDYVVRTTGSTAIRADSLHYRSDLLLNGSILLALVLTELGLERMDAVFGILISFYILWSAIKIAREATAVLMDRELSPEITTSIKALICATPHVIGCHELRTRGSGTRWFIQLHVDLPESMSLKEAHQACVQISQNIQQHYPQAEVLVHADPLSPHYYEQQTENYCERPQSI